MKIEIEAEMKMIVDNSEIPADISLLEALFEDMVIQEFPDVEKLSVAVRIRE